MWAPPCPTSKSNKRIGMKVQLAIFLIIGVCDAFPVGHHHSGRSVHLFSVSKNALDGVGAPSNPGWASGRLNRLTEWADASAPNRPIICEYNPKGRWLWGKWNGTVLKATWRSVVASMLTGFAIDFIARGCSLSNYNLSWNMLAAVPAETTPFIKHLSAVTKVWEYQLTLSTFILTFFLSQAFAYWQKMYNTTRMIQGRINDFCMLLTMGAERGVDDINNKKKPRSNASADKGSRGFSKRAEEYVTLCMRYVRLSHTFFWAQTATSSNGLNDCEEYLKDESDITIPVDDEHIGPLLLSPYGLRALVDAGQLSKEERVGLMGSGLPPSQYSYILLVWVGIHVMEGLKTGTLQGGPGFEENIFRQLATLRACMFDIDDFRAGRMPLAYVQLVQVLVDSLVVISPFALYPSVGILSIPLLGLLALFFRGLLLLSKSFLDPFGVEGYEEQCLNVDVLVSELNFGAASRWINAAGFVPLPMTTVEDSK
ncbi:hypothetical protein ACHAXR_006820 [Thalassiosira sp. AJA248-18]